MSNWSKKIGCALLSICFILAGLPGFTASASSDSSESVPSGYTAVYTREDLAAVRSNLSGKYILMNDIDLGGSAKGQWDPIGTNGNAFTGTFDGNYHVIRGLYINRSSDYQGLFGLNCGTIRDLTVQGTVTGGSYVGGIAGASIAKSSGTAMLYHVRNECTITGTGNYVGGVCGLAQASTESGSVISYVTDCTNSGTVKGYGKYTGGICGGSVGYVSSSADRKASASAYMTGCHNAASVTGTTVTGGIVGTHQAYTVKSNTSATALAKIYMSTNSGAVSSSGDACGGIVGVNDSTTYRSAAAVVDRCFNSGSVTGGGQDAGGIVSRNMSETSTSNATAESKVSNSSNTGRVKAADYAGGIVGYNCANSGYGTCYATVSTSYSRGTVSGSNAGGVIGYIYVGPNINYASGLQKVSISKCSTSYYLSGSAAKGVGYGADGATRLTDAQMQSQSSYAGFSFPSIWTMKDYPVITDISSTSRFLTINGNVKIQYKDLLPGETLSLDTADLAPSGVTYTATWYSGGKSVGTGTTYKLTDDDMNKEIYAKLQATGSYRSNVVTDTVKPTRTELSGTLGIKGPVAYDTELAAELPSDLKNATVNYSWKINGKEVSDEKTYTPGKADVGETLTLSVTGTGHYIGTLSTKAYTVDKKNIEGTLGYTYSSLKYGQTYTVDLSEVSGYEEGAFAYKVTWTLDGEYAGEGDSITSSIEDIGKAYCARVSVTSSDLYKGSLTAETVIMVSDWDNPFTDVAYGSWYNTAVQFAFENSLFFGTTKTEFSPDLPMTRAMFVAVLARMSGEQLDNSKPSSFEDVPAGKYYTGAVSWAQSCGVTHGISKTEFGPELQITREQICVMMNHYAEYTKAELTFEAEKAPFDDEDKISSYAKPSVKLMQNLGVVSGKGMNRFYPKDNATRAEVASMLRRFAAYLPAYSPDDENPDEEPEPSEPPAPSEQQGEEADE